MSEIKILKLHQEAILPKYAHPHDAGLDLYSNETVTLEPLQRHAFSTGIAMAIPKGYVGLIWDRSSMALKHGLKTMAGVIDSGYRGEVKIVLKNLSQNSVTIEKGNKIAQMIIHQAQQHPLQEVEILDDTQRGQGGFGSTGM